jgi:MoxR-like ATPase
MLTIVTGEPLENLIDLSRGADTPLLLIGHRGIGKSEAFANVAKKRGIGLLVLDLSLLEAPDLLGIPYVQDGRSRFAPPAFWPTSGEGIIVIEELNRAPRYLQAPILQLLTTRTIGDIKLPAGWWIAAAINERSDEYFVDELDAALASRFLRVRVEPSASEWLKWAAQNEVHSKIRDFIQAAPETFNDPEANPRAWVYASALLQEWERRGADDNDLISVALAGVIGDEWSVAFLRFLRGDRKPLRAADIIERYPSSRSAILTWLEAGSLDLIKSSLEALKRHLQPQKAYAAVANDAKKVANVEDFLHDLPGDLRREIAEWLQDRKFTAISVTV